jgi:hypothetical protein
LTTSAKRHFNAQRRRAGAAPIVRTAALAVLSDEFARAAESVERVHMARRHQHHIAAASAVAAVRTAARHVFLAAKMDDPIAAVAATDVYDRFI